MKERPSENRYDIQGFATFDHGDPLFSNGWRGASLRVLVVFCDVHTGDVGMGIATAVLAVIADLDVLSVAQWGSWALLLIFFLPMVSLWVRRCRALGQSPVQSLGILAMVLALSMIAPIGGLNPMAASFGTWGVLLDVALGFAMLYSVWVGLAFVANAHKVGYEPFGISFACGKHSFVIRLLMMAVGSEALVLSRIAKWPHNSALPSKN